MNKTFLQKTFASISPTYDRQNRFFTFGLDQRWRRKAVSLALANSPQRILDLCAGTGDLTRLLCDLAPPSCQIVAADFSAPMLALAQQKLAVCKSFRRVHFVEADAAALPFGDGFFDVCCISFGVRNLFYAHPAAGKHLRELARVLRPGGRLVLLETDQPRSKLLRFFNRAYFKTLVAPVGGWISKDPEAYSYLSRSALEFSHSGKFVEDLNQHGFSQVEHTSLFGGVAGITVACRLTGSRFGFPDS